MRKLLVTIVGTAIIACMLTAFSGQDKPYKDIKGESFKVIAQIADLRQWNNFQDMGFKADNIERVGNKAMLILEYGDFEAAEAAYLELLNTSETVYLEGGMTLDEASADALINSECFTRSGDMYYSKDKIQTILRRTGSGYYLTTGYPYIVSGC